jgi:hypothetical protein
MKCSFARLLFKRLSVRPCCLTLAQKNPRTLRASIRQTSWLGGLVGLGFFASNLSGDSIWRWDPRGPRSSTEIFEGVNYGCAQLEATREGGGLLHWVRINLAAPGIELYVTPQDSVAVARGAQYRLRYIQDIMASEHLAVAINGTLFTWEPRWRPPMSGDLASAVETLVADHVVSHIWEHTYVLWFDDQLTPHLRASKPPRAADLALAKWAIGGQAVWLHDGQVWPGSSREPDARTAVAVDEKNKLLFFGVAQNISPRRLLQELTHLGAKDGMLLDGGDSSAIAIGDGAAEVPPGILYGGWRPVATYFGVKSTLVAKPK